MTQFKSGYIAIVGRANAGKSTLLNSLIQQKISIVSPKPQTTRENILGIWTEEGYQMIFVDTPGALVPKNQLGSLMAKNIENAIDGVDCILLVIDGHDGIKNADLDLVVKYSKTDIPLVVAVTKTDISQPEKLMEQLSKLNAYPKIREVFALSARKNKGVEELKEHLKTYLTDDKMYFEADEVTDKSERFLVCEIIREKALLLLDKEIPHGIGIELNKMIYNELKNSWLIDANIITEKSTHKAIILGKQGSMIKSIGTYAREAIEKFLNAKVNLQLWVKIKEDWRNSNFVLTEIGYSKKD